MNGTLKRAARLILALLLLLGPVGCTGALLQGTGLDRAAPIPVTVLFLNDLHGYLQPFEVTEPSGKRSVGGIARMATLVREIRAENDRRQVRTVLLVAGDLLQGTPLSTVFQGEPDVEVLNAMGVDALAVGNHEFDFGLANFRKLEGQAVFPFLSVNILEKASGRSLCSASREIPLGKGLSLTVIGITTGELLTTTLPTHVAGLRASCSASSLSPTYEAAQTRGPVLLLSHCGVRADEALAAAYPGLAAIVGGHDHLLLSPPRQVAGVPLFQAFEKGRTLGRIDLEIDPLTRKAAVVGHRYFPITDGIPPDPQVAGIVAAYQARLGDRFKEVIGRASGSLEGDRDKSRYGETALGNFVTDTVRAYTGAQIALINSGAIRSSLDEGPVTLEDLFRAVPFANELVVMELSGAEIEQALTRAVRGSRGDKDGGFLQVSGLSFAIRGHTVEEVRVGPEQEPLEPQRIYKVAITDFLGMGGDGYRVFQGKPQLKTGLPLRELLVDTIRRQGVISATEEGRIRRRE